MSGAAAVPLSMYDYHAPENPKPEKELLRLEDLTPVKDVKGGAHEPLYDLKELTRRLDDTFQ